MNFLVILGIVLVSLTVLAGADYFIEFREQTAAASSSNAQPELVNVLFECRRDPPGASTYTAARSVCTEVTSHEYKFNIYVNCNFVMVYRPNTRAHEIFLVGRGIMSLPRWYLGFLNQAIDHPNFAVPQQQEISQFEAAINEIWPITGLRSYLIPNLAFYYAQNNIIAYSRNPEMANTVFNGFVTFLRRLAGRYLSINQESQANQLMFTAALKMSLQKMIDPCTILHNGFPVFAANYCGEYCNFFNVVALHFGATSTLGCVLQGGYCNGFVCTCVRTMVNALQGCQTSPMQQINNGMRIRLNV